MSYRPFVYVGRIGARNAYEVGGTLPCALALPGAGEPSGLPIGASGSLPCVSSAPSGSSAPG